MIRFSFKHIKLSAVLMIVLLMLSVVSPAFALIRKKNMAEGVIHLTFPFKSPDVAETTTDTTWQNVPLELDANTYLLYEYTMPFDGHVIGITAFSNTTNTAGYMEFDVTINGTRTGLQAQIDTTNTTTDYGTQRAGKDIFNAGDTIGVDALINSNLSPATPDISLVVIVGEKRE